MIVSVYVPLIAALIIGRWFRWHGFIPGHPAVQTWTITVVSIVTAAMSTWSLVLLATARIDRFAYATERLHLVGGLLRHAEHVPLLVSVGAVVYLVVRVARVIGVLSRSRRARNAADLFRSKHVGALVVVADENPIAFALAGNRRHSGTVVMSTALFTTVPVAQRRAVLAHEHSHLALHHHKHRGIVNIAVALEPLLAPAACLAGRKIERWADEHAAATDPTQRKTAADAITTFLRLTTNSKGPGFSAAAQSLGGLAYADHDASGRVAALLLAPPPRRMIHAMPVALVIMAIAASTGDATQQLAHLVYAAIR